MITELDQVLEHRPPWRSWLENEAKAGGLEWPRAADFCEQVLLAFRRAWESQAARRASKESKPARTPEEIDLLALVSAGTAMRGRWVGAPESLPKAVEGWGVAWRLVKLVAEASGLDEAEMMRAPEAFQGVWAGAWEFVQTYTARSVSAQLRNPCRLLPRLRAYLGNRACSDEQVVGKAHELLADEGLSWAERKQLCAQLEIMLLRRLSPEELGGRAKHFREWHALFEHVLTTKDPEDALVTELRGDVLKSLAGKWEGLDALCSDAVAEAWGCLAAYRYEAALPSWLRLEAETKVRQERQRSKKEVPLLSEVEDEEGEPGPEPAAPTATAAEAAAGHDHELVWRGRFLLALSFYKGNPGRLKEMWEALLMNSRGPALPKNAELAKELGVNADTLATDRRRLKQKLGVLAYVLDRVPEGAADAPGDDSVLAWVAANGGYAKTEVPTLRGLAALGRVARFDGGLLHGALLARAVAENAELDELEIARQIRQMLAVSLGAAEWASRWTRVEERVNAALILMSDSGVRNQMREIRSQAKAKTQFWVAPCWHLHTWTGQAVNVALEILRPTREERVDLIDLFALVSKLPKLN